MASSLADSLSSDDDSILAYSVIYGEDVTELSDSESEDGEDVVRLSQAPLVPPLAASPSPPPILDNRVSLNLTNVEFQDCKLRVSPESVSRPNALITISECFKLHRPSQPIGMRLVYEPTDRSWQEMAIYIGIISCKKSATIEKF